MQEGAHPDGRAAVTYCPACGERGSLSWWHDETNDVALVSCSVCDYEGLPNDLWGWIEHKMNGLRNSA
jgi:uncharacterized metal-binding protein (TIGR02443 family)